MTTNASPATARTETAATPAAARPPTHDTWSVEASAGVNLGLFHVQVRGGFQRHIDRREPARPPTPRPLPVRAQPPRLPIASPLHAHDGQDHLIVVEYEPTPGPAEPQNALLPGLPAPVAP